MIRYDDLPAPGLVLVFNPEGSHPFLKKALFKKSEGARANAKLVEDPPGRKFLCAFCIFILLVKYRGINPDSPEEEIPFRDEKDQMSWLNTLGVDRDEFEKFVTNCFGQYHFFTASRGTSRRVPAFAIFNPISLNPEKVYLYLDKPDSSPIPLKHSEIPKLAMKLEEYGLKRKGVKWVATVRRQVENLEMDGQVATGGSRKTPSPGSRGEMDGCRISPMWRKLFDESLAEIGDRGIGGEWYVVCGTPTWMLKWRHYFSDAVTRGGIVRLAHHGESAPDVCPSITAQWKMNIEYLHQADPIGYLKYRLRDCVPQLAALDETARKEKAKGRFEFYESYIVHPFVAILIVPEPLKKAGLEDHPAPKGTQCLLGMQPFYPRDVEERFGLHFYQASPSLNQCYNSIRNFFLKGPRPRDGYLKRVDHLAILRSRKGKS